MNSFTITRRICYCSCILIAVVAFLTPARALTGENTFGTIPPRTAKQLFRQHCASCHGLDGKAQTSKGKFSHARDLADSTWQDDVTDERIFNSIMNGRNVRGNMPAFSDRFSEAQVNSLVAFVRGLRK
jgi:mono/diheme cytochrome c family protein